MAPALIVQIGVQEFQTRSFLDKVDQRISKLKSEASRLEAITSKIDDLGVRIRKTTQDLTEATAVSPSPPRTKTRISQHDNSLISWKTPSCGLRARLSRRTLATSLIGWWPAEYVRFRLTRPRRGWVW